MYVRRIGTAVAVLALAASIQGAANAVTPTTYVFQTAEWTLSWNDFNFGVSSWSQGGVSLTAGANPSLGAGFWGSGPTAFGSGQVWGQVAAGGATNVLNAGSSTGTSFTLTANPGWQLSNFGISASGNYATIGAGASVNPDISLMVTTPGSTTPTISVGTFVLGTWTVDSGAIAGPVTGGPLSFTINQLVSVAALSETATSAGDSNGIQLYWSAAPVPEPSEWAMMLAGLGVVGVIAKRRRPL